MKSKKRNRPATKWWEQRKGWPGMFFKELSSDAMFRAETTKHGPSILVFTKEVAGVKLMITPETVGSVKPTYQPHPS